MSNQQPRLRMPPPPSALVPGTLLQGLPPALLLIEGGLAMRRPRPDRMVHLQLPTLPLGIGAPSETSFRPSALAACGAQLTLPNTPPPRSVEKNPHRSLKTPFPRRSNFPNSLFAHVFGPGPGAAGVQPPCLRILLEIHRLMLSGRAHAWSELVSLQTHLRTCDHERLYHGDVPEPDMLTTGL